MRLVTLAQLRTRVRRRADIQDDGNFITDEELTDYINYSISELYDLILHSENGKFFTKNAPVLTQVGTFAYELPEDVYKISAVEYYYGSRYVRGKPGEILDFPNLSANPPTLPEFVYFLRADPQTGKKYLYVFPEVDETNLAVLYIPEAPLLELDNDKWDGFSGWEEYVILDSAIKCLSKQNLETNTLEYQKKNTAKRIISQSSYFDTGQPSTVRELV